MITGAPMRRIAISSIIVTLLLVSTIPYPFAISSTVEDHNVFYFRDGTFPHLSKYPPQGEEDKTTLDGTFMLNNVTSIRNGISFDLYFKVFPFNFTPILEAFLIMITAISNMTVEQPKENRTIGEIIREIRENLSIWNETGYNVSAIASMVESIAKAPALNYTISVEIADVSTTETVTVCKGENETGLKDILSNLTLENILNNLDYIIALAQGEANVVHRELTIEDINLDIPEGDTLYIRIFAENELLQEIAPIIEVVRYANESAFQSVAELLLESQNLTKYTNATKLIKTLKWLAEVLSKNMGFVYDSYKHPSNIRFFGSVSGSEKYGAERYYLRKVKVDGDYALILDKKTIETNDTQQMNISSNMVYWISSEPFKEPTRIYGNVTAHLYIKCKSWKELGWQYPIEVSIYDKKGDSLSKIASGVAKAFIYTHLLAPQPLDVVIENVDYTFEEGHYLVMGIRMVNKTLESLGIELVLYRPLLFFNSKNYSSYIEISTAPLDDIRLEFSGNTTISPEIRRVDTAHYNIEITNEGETGDNLTLSLMLIDKNLTIWPEGWRAKITILNSTEIADFDWKKQVYISGKGTLNLSIDIYPSPDAEDESEVEFRFSATGTYRGSDIISDEIKINVGKPEAVLVAIPNDKKVEVGSTFKYIFRVKNVGNDVDDFVVNATSEHGWIAGDSAFVIEDLYPGNETEFSITLKIPGNLSSTPVEDDLIVRVSPESRPSAGDEVWIVTTAVEISIFEKIGRFFGGISNSLKEKLGETGYIALIVLIITIILLILFFSIYMLTRKYAELICLDRIKELSPGKETRFEVTVRNPSKMRLNYDVYLDKDVIQEGWVADLSEKELVLDPGEERKVFVHVKATERIDPDGFSRIRLVVIPKEKPKVHSIDLLVTSKNATVDLKIEKVSHSPKRFKSGETVTTKFILRNDGTVMAKNVRVSLRVNGEEVNSANIDEIPPGSYAEVEMPWIAYLGRNDIAITAEM